MIQQLSQFDFHHRIGAQRGACVVLFTAPGCGACRHLKGMLAGMTDLQVFEIDAARDPGLAREFEVFHLPALFLYRDGAYHRSLECAAHPAAIRNAIATTLALPPEEAP